MKFKYFINNECKDYCDGYYKFETSDESLEYTQCFDSVNEVLKAGNGIKAYNIQFKLCWKDIPDGYYVNKIIRETGGINFKYEVVLE